MAIRRSMICDVCGVTEIEPKPNEGWKGWCGIQGVSLNGVDNPNLCPTCTVKVMAVIDKMVTPNGVD